MKVQLTSKAAWEKALAEHGIKSLPPDHPVYSEPPSITFLSRTQKPLQPKVIDSPLNGSESDAD